MLLFTWHIRLVIFNFRNPLCYIFSPYIKNKEERETNKRVIRMLAYIVYYDTSNEYRNRSDFMNEFESPSHFEPFVKEIIYD